MSDYRGQIDDCDRLHADMRRKGILSEIRTVYFTPDGKEFDNVADACKFAPVLRPGEWEPVFDHCHIIGYRKLTNGPSEN